MKMAQRPVTMEEPLRSNTFARFSGEFSDRLNPSYFTINSGAFSNIISKTHDHFWDPNDPKYLDYTTPFNVDEDLLVPISLVPELSSPLAARLTARQQVHFVNDSIHWWLSNFLYGEMAAHHLALELSGCLQDIGAAEYLANQAREEARHVSAFTRYINTRWSFIRAPSPVFASLLSSIIDAKHIHRKIVGMQILIEGVAMGFMASLHGHSADRLLVRLSQLVMADESFHHKAGKLWATHGLPRLSSDERADAEDWALKCFETLMFNIFHPSQKSSIYAKYDLAVTEVQQALRESYDSAARRAEIAQSLSVFRLVIKTLLTSGIVTERTRWAYERWIDVEAVEDRAASPVEDLIAAAGLDFLRGVNLQLTSK